jgi:hypothetical protein
MACNCINSILTGCSTEELTELAKILAAQGIGPIATNLAYIAAPANGTITSSTGGPAVVPLATSTNAGLLSPALYTKITAGGGTGTANTLPKFISDSLFGNSHITDDGTLITLTGDVKFQLLQNSAANINIDMPAITNNPPEIGGVPDAVLIRIRGHNGLTASVVSGINCVIEGRRNVGFAVAVATGTTESYAFEATFPTNTTGNYFLKLRNGQVNKFTVTDRGALFAETITYRMGIYYADALDNLDR